MLSKLSVKKPLLIVVLVIIVIALGVVSYLNTSVDLLPEMDLPFIVVVTVYPGAVPDVVEKSITTPIESVVSKISGVKKMTSTSAEHYSMITLELSSAANASEVKQDIESGLKLISLPSDPLRQDPIIIEISAAMLPMMTLSIGVANETIENVSDYLEGVVSRLSSIDGVGSASPNGLVSNLVFMNLNSQKTAQAFATGLADDFGFEIKLSDNQKETIRTNLKEIVEDAEEDPTLSTDGEIDPDKVLDRLIERLEESQGDGTSEENLISSILIPELKNKDSEFRKIILETIELVLENVFMLEDGEENKKIFGDIVDQIFYDGIMNLAYGYTSSMLSVINAEILSQIIMAQDFDMPAGSIKQGATSFVVKIGNNVNSREEFMNTAAVSIDIGNIIEEYIVRIETILTILSYTAEEGIYKITESDIASLSEQLARVAEEVDSYSEWVINNVVSDFTFSRLYMSDDARAAWKATIEENEDYIALIEGFEQEIPAEWRTQVFKLVRDLELYLPDDTVIAEALLWDADYTEHYLERIENETQDSLDNRILRVDYDTDEDYKTAFLAEAADYVIDTANNFSVFTYALSPEQVSEWRNIINTDDVLGNNLVALPISTYWHKYLLRYVTDNDKYPVLSPGWNVGYSTYYENSFNATFTALNATKPANVEGYANWAINLIANRVPNTEYSLTGSFLDSWVIALKEDVGFVGMTDAIVSTDNWQYVVLQYMSNNSSSSAVIPVATTITAARIWSSYKATFVAAIEGQIATFTTYEVQINAIKETVGEEAFDSYLRMFSGRGADDIYNMIVSIIEVIGDYGGEGAVVTSIDSGEKTYAIDVNIIKTTIREATDSLTVDIKLGNIADILFLNDSSKLITRLVTNDGQGNFSSSPSVVIVVEKEADASTTQVSAEIRKLLDTIKGEKENFTYNIISDDGEMIGFMMGSVLQSLLWGAVLAAVVLLIFFKRIKPTIAVSIAIVFSVVFTFVLMYFAKITLNIVSMGGLTLGVGMLVDNSIVVIENIQRLRLQGKTRFEAAIQGAKQMTSAIFASTLTTIVVFLPIVFIQGLVKEILADMALTVCFSLLASLFVALTVIPLSTAYLIKELPKPDSRTLRAVKKAYVKSLNFSLNNKFLVLFVTTILFAGMLVGGFVFSKKEVFPTTYMGSVSVSFDINNEAIDERNFGLSIMDENYIVYEDIEAEIVQKAINVFNNYSDINAVAIYSATGMNMGGFSIGGGALSASLSLVTEKNRVMDPFDLCDAIERSLNAVGGNLFTTNVAVSSIMSFSGSLADTEYSIYLFGNDYDLMVEEADKLAQLISASDKIMSVRKNVDTAAEEYKLIVDKDEASKHGLTTGQVYLQISDAIKTVSPSHTLRLYADSSNIVKTDYEVMIYSEIYKNKSWHIADRKGTPTKIFTNNNYDYTGVENEYFVKNNRSETIFVKDKDTVKVVGANGMIPVTLSQNKFIYEYALITENADEKTHDVAYLTEEMIASNMTQFYSVKREEIDLLMLSINGSDVLGTGASTKKVPLYKLLTDDCFEKDSEGNVLYRLGFSEDIPASLVKAPGYTGIKHAEGRKIITLTVEYDGAFKEADAVNDINQIVAVYNKTKPSTILVDTKEAVGIMDEVFNNLYLILGAAILLIFLIMVAQFQSWKKPFIVMFTVPLAFTGSFALMLLTGTSINIMSLIGMIILMGVAVNNGIVFVDYADKVIESGVDKKEALLKTGVDRLRPILLTALTTISAMIIMATNRTDYGLLLAPIAITMVGGLTYATFVTLYVVPIAYDIINRKYKVPEEFKALKDANIDKIDEDNIFEETDTFYAEIIGNVMQGKPMSMISALNSNIRGKKLLKQVNGIDDLSALSSFVIGSQIEENSIQEEIDVEISQDIVKEIKPQKKIVSSRLTKREKRHFGKVTQIDNLSVLESFVVGGPIDENDVEQNTIESISEGDEFFETKDWGEIQDTQKPVIDVSFEKAELDNQDKDE